jgi:hypothetical protein
MTDRTTLVQRLRAAATKPNGWAVLGASAATEAADELDRLQRELAEAHELFDADVIDEIYGPRCDEYEAGCAGCRAWRWHDAFLAGNLVGSDDGYR